MKITELLDKYFEGATSCEEERELRRFFTQEKVPGDLEMYRPLFVYLNQGAEGRKKKQRNTPSLFYIIGSIAAGLLLLVGIAKILIAPAAPENYVIIDGIRYTDERLVKTKAMEALNNAGFTEEDLNGLLFQNE